MNNSLSTVCSGNQSALVQLLSQHQNCSALAELKQRKQWVCWKLEKTKDKNGNARMTKPPYNPNGKGKSKKASHSNPLTWSTFNDVYQAFLKGGYDGIGYVFTEDDPFVGVDLDHVYDNTNGNIVDWAQEIIDSLDSYTEISPGGDGFHIFAKGDIPRGGNKKKLLDADGGDDAVFEIYKTTRYFTFTMNTWDNPPKSINDRNQLLNDLFQQYIDGSSNPSVSNPVIQQAQVPISTAGVQSNVVAGIDLSSRGLRDEVIHKINTSYPTGERSEAGFSVLCSLIKAGFNDAEISGIFQLAPIGDKAKEKGINWFQQELGRAKAKMAQSLSGNNLIEGMKKLNNEHAVVMLSGKTYVLNKKYNPDYERDEIEFSSVDSFYQFHANKNFQKTVNGKDRTIYIAKEWMKWADRPTFNGVTFAPGRDIKDYYNLFQGFAVEAKQGDWSKMKRHIEDVICAGNQEHSKWLIAWMAHVIQNPGGPRPGTSPVLLSEPGAGKGIFVSNFGKLFGSHYLQVTQRQHLTGNFNNHLRNALLVFCDEGVWGGDKQAEGVLKGLITEDNLMIEPKRQDAQKVRNFINMIIASNERWVVPASIKERRYFVLDVSNDKRGDTAYFAAIADEMKNGGIEAMYYDLLNMTIDAGINLRKAPKTKALFKQMMQGFSAVRRYWFECLCSGSLDQEYEDEYESYSSGSVVWPQEIENDRFFAYYLDFAKQQGFRWTGTRSEFLDQLYELYPFKDKHMSVGKRRPRGKVIPDLDEARREFCKVVEIDIDW